MKFSIDKMQLAYAAWVASKIIATAAQGDSKYIYIRAENDSAVFSARTSEGNSAEVHIKTEVAEGGSVATDAKLFGALAEKVYGDTITLEDGGNTIKISHEGGEVLAPNIPNAIEPKFATDAEKVFTVNYEAFKNTVKAAASFCAKDESRPQLRGIHISTVSGGNALIAEGCDGIRMARLVTKLSEPAMRDLNAIVPATGLQLICALANGTDDIDIGTNKTRNTIIFRQGDLTLQLVTYAGKYIDTDRIIPKTHNSVVTVNKSELERSLELLAVSVEKNTNSRIGFDATESPLKLSATAQNSKVDERLRCVIDGKPVKLYMNCRHLLDILNCLKGDDVNLQFVTERTPIIVGEGDNIFLTMPFN